MKTFNLFIFSLIILLLGSCAKEKSGTNYQGSGGGTFSGNLTLASQAQVDSFGGLNYDEIEGGIKIEDITGAVNNLDALCSIN
jgi:hypothetical protein